MSSSTLLLLFAFLLPVSAGSNADVAVAADPNLYRAQEVWAINLGAGQQITQSAIINSARRLHTQSLRATQRETVVSVVVVSVL